MKKSSLVFFLWAALLSCAPVHGQEAAGLCSPPLNRACIQPNWGQIDPAGFVAEAASAPHDGAGNRRITMRLMPAVSTDSLHGSKAQLKVPVDGTPLFKKETDALVAAIEKAGFDAKGNIVTGAAKIDAAAKSAMAAAPNYALTLYIGAPLHLSKARQQLLNNELSTINKLLDRLRSNSRG